MLTLDEFKKAIETIQAHEKDNKILTNIMLKNSNGIIDYGFDIAALCVKMIALNMGDKDEWISWWLYENVNKVVTYKHKVYDVSTPTALYYLVQDKFGKLQVIEETGEEK